jgi:hypothetical protein
VLDSGCVTFAANSSSDTAEYLVLAQSAGGAAGSFAPFDLASASPSPSGPAPSFAARQAQASRGGSANGHTAVTFDMYLRSIGRAGRYPPVPLASPPVVSVPPRPAPTGPPALGSARTFKVCSNMSCSALANVGATVRAVGAHIAIYVDTLAPAGGLDSADYDALKQVFDTLLYPLDTATFGSVSDIDANTVVMVLMSNTVNRLVSNSRCISSGYIAGFFFPGDLDPGFAIQFNNGEVFYSIVADPGGTLSCSHSTGEVKNVMPVTFTHEFQHMINFVQHVRIRGGDSEEGWLDEGLSKYAEEIAGRARLSAGSACLERDCGRHRRHVVVGVGRVRARRSTAWRRDLHPASQRKRHGACVERGCAAAQYRANSLTLAGWRRDRRGRVVEHLDGVSVPVRGRIGRRSAVHQVRGGGTVRQNPQRVPQLMRGDASHAGRDLRLGVTQPHAELDANRLGHGPGRIDHK